MNWKISKLLLPHNLFPAWKNVKQAYFNQCLKCPAPKHWSKYTTLNVIIILVPKIFLYSNKGLFTSLFLLAPFYCDHTNTIYSINVTAYLFIIIDRISGSVLILDQKIWNVVIIKKSNCNGWVTLTVSKRSFPQLLKCFSTEKKV